jgi:hypothetical protein
MAEDEQCEEEWVSGEMRKMENGLQRAFTKWLRPLRILSKTLDKAITPFVYRSCNISRPNTMRELATNGLRNIKVGEQPPNA